ncbi:MAG TPA: amino acid permease [Vicinamibacterales bacterium]|nr:amino acid permease [Vicinamibacterales bacterium]
MAQPAPPATAKTLGFTSLVCLIIANMIGAGVFTTSGFALGDLGTPHRVMAAWVVGGVIALSGALSYAGLVRRITDSGGEYLFLSRLIHPVAGFIAGWVSLLAGFTGAIAFAARAFETYAFPTRPDWLPNGLAAVGMVLLAAALHGVKVQTGAVSQNVVVIVKVVMLSGFLAFAASVAASQGMAAPPPNPMPFSILAFAGSLVWISLSYSGFNAAVYVAGEAKDAQRNAPKALWVGTLIVTVIYVALNAAFVYLPPFESVVGREDVAAAAAQAFGGAGAAAVIRFVTVLALVTSVFSLVMAGPRVYARMADDGVFPRFFRFGGAGAPTAAIVAQTALAIAAISLSDLRGLLSYLGFTLSLSAALTVASLFLIARREGRAAVSVWGYPFTPAFYVLSTLVLAGLAGRRAPMELLASIITIASGSLVYYGFGLHRVAAPTRAGLR